MRKYARNRARDLLHRLASELEKSGPPYHPDAIHDIRVAIRRLSRCLRALAQFFPPGARRKTLRRLRGLMDLAAAVRDRDIALELFAASGIPPGAAVMARLRRQRGQSLRALLEEIAHWRKRSLPDRLSRKLEL
jgi:CHAD domain-containing protein